MILPEAGQQILNLLCEIGSEMGMTWQAVADEVGSGSELDKQIQARVAAGMTPELSQYLQEFARTWVKKT